MSNDSTAEAVGSTVCRLVWFYTAIVFLLKLTRWIDWSWKEVFAPLAILYALALALFGLGLSLRAFGNWAEGRASKPYERPQDHDVSHIEPLDSIKNPRKS